MRKYMFAALVALCLAVPGMATGNSLILMESDSYRFANPEMDPQLVQDILRAAAEQCEYDYATLQGWYDDGEVTIEKIENGYRVTDGGGMITIIIEDSF